MWSKIFRNKSKKCTSREYFDEISGSSVNNGHSFNLTKVLSKLSVKSNGRTLKDQSTVTKSDGHLTNTDQSQELEIPSEECEAKISLELCATCTRTFTPKALTKHILICEKTLTKKRKTFDSSKQRREGTDLADFLPKNFGLPPSKHEPKESQGEKVTKQVSTTLSTTFSQKRDRDSRTTAKPKNAAISTCLFNISNEKPKPVISRLVLTAEPCPYCKRSFGLKAYERHVEWCKEKSRITSTSQNSSPNVAKERLKARTKYKAPCLKTKRSVNREKYSGLSCEESLNNVSDTSSGESVYKSKEYQHEAGSSVETSVVPSSIISSEMNDGFSSDKYNPYISAKRQLEELCSATEELKHSADFPLTLNIKSDCEPRSRLLSAASTNKLSDVKTTFRRTYSLRNTSKNTNARPVFSSNSKQKPTVQRGISDEGPISTSFLKPEEYDEMPVKSVCINDFASNRQSENQNTATVVKRAPSTNLRRRNLKMSLTANERKVLINPLLKTDSLAVFLHYENATKSSGIHERLTEKDLKEKSNNLSKQTSAQSSGTDLDFQSDKDTLSSLKNSLSNLLNTHTLEDCGKDKSQLDLTESQSIRLESFNSDHMKSNCEFKANDFIDPKLINVCDNLSINLTKLSDNDLASSSIESIEKVEQWPDNQYNPKTRNTYRNSAERKNLLKRQLRLNKNHFLYDHSPENINIQPELDNCSFEEIDSNRMDSTVSLSNPNPDAFDIEEFISSFENVEEYPLLKNYKDFLSNCSLHGTSNNSRDSSRSPGNTISNVTPKDKDRQNEEKNEIFSSNDRFFNHEALYPRHENMPMKDPNLNYLDENKFENISSLNVVDDMDNNFKASDPNENFEVVENDNNFNIYPQATNNIQVSPNRSSLEAWNVKKNITSKPCADSDYGSLSRETTYSRPSSSRTQGNSTETAFAGNFEWNLRKHSSQLNIDFASSTVGLSKLSTKSVDTDMRMSKFCHECGNRFTLAQAKFCMECGVKRIVLA